MKTHIFYTNSDTYTINQRLNSFNFLRFTVTKVYPSYMVRYYDIAKCATFQRNNVIIAPYTPRLAHQKTLKNFKQNK